MKFLSNHVKNDSDDVCNALITDPLFCLTVYIACIVVPSTQLALSRSSVK